MAATTSSSGGMNKRLLKAAISGETPLMAALTNGHVSVASFFLRSCCQPALRQAILQQDKHGYNALHHAIRNGHKDLALQLVTAEPALSEAVSKCNESPMFFAVMRGFTYIYEKLMQNPDCAYSGGQHGCNCLHAAVRNGDREIAKIIIEKRPELAREADNESCTPVRQAVLDGKIDMLRLMLEHDSTLGYEINSLGNSLLTDAALREFVEFVLKEPLLRKVVNMQNKYGKTALHYAVDKCNPRIVAALLSHEDIDATILENKGFPAAWQLWGLMQNAKTLNWFIGRVERHACLMKPTNKTSSSEGMNKRLLEAAIRGDSTSMYAMAALDRSILLGKTPQGNTCLHISSMHGHQGFCKDVVELEQSLLAAINLPSGETPLTSAVRYGQVSVASCLLGSCCQPAFRQAILQQDIYGFNALHHSIRNGHKDLALELIEAEPALSQAVTKRNESPLFFAVKRKFTHIYENLMQNPDCAYSGGQYRENCLHAAVKHGDQEIARMIMEKRPELAREFNNGSSSPVTYAALYGKIDMLQVMLEHDSTLGYQIFSNGNSLLGSAAYRGQVAAAREILKHCPDAPYNGASDGETFLHVAVQKDHAEFVEFVLKTPLLRKVVNMQTSKGKTALHYAIRKCNPRIVIALLSHEDIDATVQDDRGNSAFWDLSGVMENAKTLNWNEVIMLMSRACPQDVPSLHNLQVQAKQKTTYASRKDAKSLTQTYTTNTSLVAILIATITFAAAFTLPGGYSNDAGTEGLPIMSKKFAFHVFLISDTLAMCSSFAVAFICIIARWEDYKFLIYYRSFTKKLMWFAYVATTTAFSTGLYTVLVPRLQCLCHDGILICVMVALLPILTKLLGEWPVLKLRVRLGKSFNSDLLDMV
ncbi:hypothetical protein ACQ4PT_046753 [Festuca glaucescens]